MILSRFYSRNKRCTACNKFLEDERIILVPENGNGCYCYECKGKKLSDAGSDGREERYIPFFNNGNVARIFIDRRIFTELENGIHRFLTDGLVRKTFVYESRRYENYDLHDFYRDGVRWYHVLEKSSDFSCFFFPSNEIGDESDIVRYVPREVDLFCEFTGTDEADIRYLVDDTARYYHEVVGVISKAGKSKESRIVKNCFDYPITEKSRNDIIEKYKKYK